MSIPIGPNVRLINHSNPEFLDGALVPLRSGAADQNLLRTLQRAAPELEAGYCIFNVAKSTLLHIDDNALNAALCLRMREKGCEVIDDPVNQSIGVENVKLG